MYDEWSLKRNAVASATSLGLPKRAIGIFSVKASLQPINVDFRLASITARKMETSYFKST